METLIGIILQAGKDALHVSLYILLPIMVVMMVLVKILDVLGILDKCIAWLSPITRPFGLSGLGLLCMIQISFVSFVAPVATLKLMEQRGVNQREIAASFAAVLAMAPANALFPLAVYGLQIEKALIYSFIGGLLAATATFWVFGKTLPNQPHPSIEIPHATDKNFSLISIINTSGREAIDIVINIIPMLLLSLVVVHICQKFGLVTGLSDLLSPILAMAGADNHLILPTLTKYLAGCTALVGVLQQMYEQHTLSPTILNLTSVGFLLHPLDLPGVAIFISAGVKIRKVVLPAMLGALVGISGRIILGLLS